MNNTTSSSDDDLLKRGIRHKKTSREEMNNNAGEIHSTHKLDKLLALRKGVKAFTLERKVMCLLL